MRFIFLIRGPEKIWSTDSGYEKAGLHGPAFFEHGRSTLTDHELSDDLIIKESRTINTGKHAETIRERVIMKEEADIQIEITEERNYMVVVSANAVGGEITFTMTDENGEEVFSKTSSNMLISSTESFIASTASRSNSQLLL